MRCELCLGINNWIWPKSTFHVKVKCFYFKNLNLRVGGGEAQNHSFVRLQAECALSEPSLFCQHNALPLLLTYFIKMLISFSSRTYHQPNPPKGPVAGLLTIAYLLVILTPMTWWRRLKAKKGWRSLSLFLWHRSRATDWFLLCHIVIMQYFIEFKYVLAIYTHHPLH